MYPSRASTGETPRVHVVPDEGKIFEATYISRTYYGRSADFVEIDRQTAEKIEAGEVESLDEILEYDTESPAEAMVRAGKVQLNCVDGVVRYIANKRIKEVYEFE